MDKIPYVLNGTGLCYERVEDSNSFGPVLRATKIGELDSLGDGRSHEFSWTEKDTSKRSADGEFFSCVCSSSMSTNPCLARQREVWNEMIAAPLVDPYRA
ncbi:hypothetical protein E5676_scaffold255G004330 [Cucumis melo var. makuwa]|uniref:Uncharacterized protein n=1 Tax=Cucumis melo var. makuwa TaxID=1194695 RepID=A0A5D3CM02_CUCMM|nr:hypothetical protein E5676_scaffold255G004330 [Cucumis melo var. makuwa]